MKIDRNNYEEYFLLYADDELSDQEKIEVLQFIREHKDLEGEFRMILDTICKPDDVAFENKTTLFRSADSKLISDQNYEEIFVLYHDGELNEEERSSTELFVKHHPELQKVFETIGMAKIPFDDGVQFPGKKHLYKKEKGGKVVPIIFWRSLAAAVFTGFGLWFFLYYQQHVELPTAKNEPVPVQKSIPAIVNNLKQPAHMVAPAIKDEKKENKPQQKIKEIPQKQEPEYAVKVQKKSIPSIVAANIKNKKTGDVINGSAATKIIDSDVTIPVTVAVGNNESQNPGPVNDDVAIGEKTTPDVLENKSDKVSQAQQASFTNDRNENYVFYNVTTEEFRKSKVGGFLKKVKRIVERNNPVSRLLSGDEKQVASNQFMQ